MGEIDLLIGKLSEPVSAAELEDGWHSESKKAVRNYFERLRNAVVENSPLPSLHVIRSLDAWGVNRGDLAERALRVTSALM